MKTVLFITALIVSITGTSYKHANDPDWGTWKQSAVNEGIDYRVSYDDYNEVSAREGKPAHVWRIQIRNRYESKKYVSWKVDDPDTREPSNVHEARNVRGTCINAGDYTEDGLWFTNVPKDGLVEVAIWPVENCPY